MADYNVYGIVLPSGTLCLYPTVEDALFHAVRVAEDEGYSVRVVRLDGDKIVETIRTIDPPRADELVLAKAECVRLAAYVPAVPVRAFRDLSPSEQRLWIELVAIYKRNGII